MSSVWTDGTLDHLGKSLLLLIGKYDGNTKYSRSLITKDVLDVLFERCCEYNHLHGYGLPKSWKAIDAQLRWAFTHDAKSFLSQESGRVIAKKAILRFIHVGLFDSAMLDRYHRLVDDALTIMTEREKAQALSVARLRLMIKGRAIKDKSLKLLLKELENFK